MTETSALTFIALIAAASASCNIYKEKYIKREVDNMAVTADSTCVIKMHL